MSVTCPECGGPGATWPTLCLDCHEAATTDVGALTEADRLRAEVERLREALRRETADAADLREALAGARSALHRACLKIGSTEGFRNDFQAINDALSRENR